MQRIVAKGLILGLLLCATSRARAESISYTGYVYQSTATDNYGGGSTPMYNGSALGPGNADGLTTSQINIVKAAYVPTYSNFSGLGGTGGAIATFTGTTNPHFSATSSDYTLGAFVTSGGGTGLATTGSNGSDFAKGRNGYGAGASLNNTLIGLVGTISLTTGQYVTLSSDDGSSLYFANSGTPFISMADPQVNTGQTVQYEGTSGSISFTLVYGEVNGAPADLSLSVSNFNPAVVPEPASVAMMAIGLAAIGGYQARRRMRASA